jgi:broad specificity phosphatase PhoE
VSDAARAAGSETPAREPLEDVVLFDVGLYDGAFYPSLRAERLAWLHFRGGRRYVAAPLRPEAEDLALLLRRVEAWLGEHGVARMRFELDGRSYSLPVLHAAPPDRPRAVSRT